MDNLRLVLVFSLALVLLLIYQAWVEDYGDSATSSSTTEQASPIVDQDKPISAEPSVPAPPAVNSPRPPAASPSPSDATPTTSRIRAQTDLLRLEISPRGGTLISAWMQDYPQTLENPKEKFRLMKPDIPNVFIAPSGLEINIDGPMLSSEDATFSASATDYQLSDDASTLTIDLLWEVADGIEVIKRYQLERGSYALTVTTELRNTTSRPVNARSFTELMRSEYADATAPRFVRTYTGGVYYSPEEKYQKVSFDDMTKHPLQKDVVNGWIAMIQHYFLAAWIPPRDVQQTFTTQAQSPGRYVIRADSPIETIAPETTHRFNEQLYVGPKLPEVLEKLAPGLDLAVDYGWLTVIAKPIHWLLAKIHSFVGNWGWSIIVLTLLIKLAFYKLSETSYKSMAHLRQVAPRLQALKDRYGDDKERLNQAMMELYKTEKINPLGGCLPIFVQIPVFIALYWVLLESVELRQAPFMFWINDLSAPDPYFVLPLVMGVSMFVQQKLNPAPPDPMQAKLMMSLPFVFTVFFAFFPSGLVLYWTVNNMISIAQQWYITRTIEKAAEKSHR